MFKHSEPIKRIGWGSVSLLLVLLGILWSSSFGPPSAFCLGDTVLNAIGLRAWSNSGFHLAVLYSIIFFAPAMYLAYKFKDDFGAKAGRSISIIAVILLAILFFYRV